MLSDLLLDEFCRAAPLSPALLSEAWASLSTESKLEIIYAAGKNRALYTSVLDLALADTAAIVRAFAARSHTFGVHDLMRPEERADELRRVQLIEREPSFLVREAAKACGNLGLLYLEQVPQLARLVRIRNLDRSDGEHLAQFVAKGLATGDIPLSDIRDCLMEYFAGDAFKADLERVVPRAAVVAGPSVGWDRLWALAASVPEELGFVLAAHLPYEFERWKVSPALLHALPNELKKTVVFGDSAPAEEMRQTLLKVPNDYDAELVQSAARYYSFVVDEGGGPVPHEDRFQMKVESMPYRQEATFLSLQHLRRNEREQRVAIDELQQRLAVFGNSLNNLRTCIAYLFVTLSISMGVLFFAPPEWRGYIWVALIVLVGVGATLAREYAQQIVRAQRWLLRWLPAAVLVGIVVWAINRFYPGHGDAISSVLFVAGLLAGAAFVLFRLTRAVVRCVQGYRAAGWQGFWKAANEKIW
jgi:hypothetical protein